MRAGGDCGVAAGGRWLMTLALVSAGLAAVSPPPPPSPPTPPRCRLSEFPCGGGGGGGPCVALDRFCDGADDCGDKSDEPRYCSPCNRTYYGDVGRTYELEVRRPREDRLPFLCHLNFTAAGGDYGDIVQLTFDTFTVGKFVSFTSDGCPDGHMSIREAGRPSTGGQWCGSAWGYTVYYSETPSINLTLLLYKLSEQGIGYNFNFKLSYKVLREEEARVRYGNLSAASNSSSSGGASGSGNGVPAWRGDLVPGSYCDRVLERCDARACRVQSPNYPGVYPRNATCYYRVEQRPVPSGRHALIAVSQRHSHKVHIKDQVAEYDRTQRVLRVWEQCNVVQDYLTIYDGSSTTDPVLVRLCGGDAVPDIVSSGPNMLLEFHTSPYDNPFHPVPLSYLPGFELQVEVVFVDARSHSYVRDRRHCEFLLTSFDAPWGEVESPQHSLPPNTTCRYHFQGRRHETVWLSFLKFHRADWDTGAAVAGCVRLWDGRLDPVTNSSGGGGAGAVQLLGEFCKEEAPRLCDHSLLSNSTRHTRPCALPESYVSSGPELTLDTFQASALFPLSFLLRYEFVDTSLEGAPAAGAEAGPCDRVFRSSPLSPRAGRFQSPGSVFLYGRGGAHNLSCVLRFEAAPGERVRLTLARARFGGRPCQTRRDADTDRWSCAVPPKLPLKKFPRRKRVGVAELSLSEYPWTGVKIQRDCFCSPVLEPVVIDTLTASTVEVNFTVTFMNITQDFKDFFFDGEYEFISSSDASTPACGQSKENVVLRGSSGEILLGGAAVKPPTTSEVPKLKVEEGVQSDSNDVLPSRCIHLPWLIQPEDALNNYLYVKIAGWEITGDRRDCPTPNRILVHSGDGHRPSVVVCPASAGAAADNEVSGGGVVDVFSDGWDHRSPVQPADILPALRSPHARSLVVEFLERRPGTSYAVTWMEVSRRPLLSASSYLLTASSAAPSECLYRCPELNACISAALWCDGARHCPSGFDEDDANCAYQAAVPVLYAAIGGAALAALVLLVAATLLVRVWRRRRARSHKPPPQLVSAAGRRPNGRHFHTDPLFLDAKDAGLC
ncbi:uncharacterized protein LOC124733414 [Schistocerca piceifrons]|uniref:uncharacterized protein LOC124733414 n=1 Tax=Schistocerca piceifrons TaxID=274613 RepID=UPI001F5E43C4|nr:uncharacterized protein LOC124733414 [Schistocerca piceifrons]